ncbi:hypothetical protein RHGRI_034193 [Rhododendron griersonianum]|uniref:Uncharacterized protein n=1 Tax=Rhododendron griersonianum TaxID=479676 RepID=A0AAV6I2U2_9ERIC|nr:hypothetical protein RHGRI_034193 [Rhododendron griersonianum]
MSENDQSDGIVVGGRDGSGRRDDYRNTEETRKGFGSKLGNEKRVSRFRFSKKKKGSSNPSPSTVPRKLVLVLGVLRIGRMKRVEWGRRHRRNQSRQRGWWSPASVSNVDGELVEAAAAGEDEEADIDVAEDREFAGFLHETAASFREGDLKAVLVFDSLQLRKGQKSCV